MMCQCLKQLKIISILLVAYTYRASEKFSETIHEVIGYKGLFLRQKPTKAQEEISSTFLTQPQVSNYKHALLSFVFVIVLERNRFLFTKI